MRIPLDFRGIASYWPLFMLWVPVLLLASLALWASWHVTHRGEQ